MRRAGTFGDCMKRHFHLAIWAALAWSPPLLANTPEGVSAEQIAANAAAMQVGEQIFRHDQAAWHASDVLFAQIRAEDYPELRSFVTEELDNGNIGLVFYSELDGDFAEFARYEMDAGKLVSGGRHEDPADHPLSDGLKRQVQARVAAMEEGVRQQLPLCSAGPANIVSLPPDKNDQIAVYILSPPLVPGRFPLGGHYRFMVGADGKLVSGRMFEDSCLDAPRMDRYMQGAPDNFPFVHMLDPQPTEIHHYAARNMRLPLEVTAGGTAWDIDYTIWSAEEIAAAQARVAGPGSQRP